MLPKLYLLLISILLLGCSSHKDHNYLAANDLVIQNNWFIAGPAVETEENVNNYRKHKGVISVTAKRNPVGEIELNVPITPLFSNDGNPTDLSDESTYVEITYQSTQEIKLQAREGNAEGTGCAHGGSHPMVSVPPSPDSFVTIKLYWTDFKLDNLPNGKMLDIHNLCKFNFVNYHPVENSKLIIKSVHIQNLNKKT